MNCIFIKKLVFCLFCLSSILYNIQGFAEPPRKIPKELRKYFTLNGRIPVLRWYLDDTYPSDRPKFFSKKDIDAKIEAVKSKQVGCYGITDKWLYKALEQYPIDGKDVVIIGSIAPWYESVIIAYGGHPTTIEYNKIITDDPRLTVMTPLEYEENPKKFDVILSISSIEHDGLGRYGDPINPNGDIEFMAMAKEKLLKDSGHMILAVPIGQDALVWNAHRIYGRIRFPMLIEGWEIVGKFGFNKAQYKGVLGNFWYQPVFYLAPRK